MILVAFVVSEFTTPLLDHILDFVLAGKNLSAVVFQFNFAVAGIVIKMGFDVSASLAESCNFCWFPSGA